LVNRLATVRATWGARAVAGVEIVYVVGSGEAPMPDWVTVIDAPDDYASLPAKVHGIHQWLLGRDFDWVFKCDDDTYVVIDRLLAEIGSMAQGEFLGSSGFHPVFASGGAGYLMHREASQRLANDPAPGPGPEDVHFSNRLRDLGYAFRGSHRLRYASLPEDLPTPDNQIITCHWMKPARMRQLHDTLVGASRDAALAERYRVAHEAWGGELLLFRDGIFLGGGGAPDGLWRRQGDRLHLQWFDWPEEVVARAGNGWRNDIMMLEPQAG
jgi:hypothetical protein